MRIAVIGTGALGCLLAATLQPDHDVIMVGRWPAQLEAIATNGLTLIAPDGRHSHHPLRTTDHPTRAAADVALIAVKSSQTARAAEDAAIVLGPTLGLGITLQNGLGHLPILAAQLGTTRATAAVTAHGATLEGLGTVRHAGFGPTTIGVSKHLDAQAQRLASDLANTLIAAGWDCTLSDNLNELIWRKLAVNAAINPLTAVLEVTNGVLLTDARLTAVLDAAAREVATVAQAQGIALAGDEVIAQARQVAADTAANRSSMLQDIQRGVPTEIDAICGAVVDAAAQKGVSAPINSALRDLVHQRERTVAPLDRTAILDVLARAMADRLHPAEAPS